MQIKLDGTRIVSWARVGGFPDGIEVETEIFDGLEPEKWLYCDYVDGKIVFNEGRYNIETQRKSEEEAKEAIRERRAVECFAVIDRSPLWYSRLTAEQYDELMEWYLAWLDAPETGVMPEKPEWLK
jgi:hypothetical protein